MSTDTVTVVVSVASSVATTLAVHAVQAWRYRPRPVDPELINRAMRSFVRAAQGK